MRENFQNIDGKKLEIVHEIKSAYDEGKISLEEARKALKDRVQHLAPYEIAIIEQEMVEETEDECIKRRHSSDAGGLPGCFSHKREFTSGKSSYLLLP